MEDKRVSEVSYDGNPALPEPGPTSASYSPSDNSYQAARSVEGADGIGDGPAPKFMGWAEWLMSDSLDPAYLPLYDYESNLAPPFQPLDIDKPDLEDLLVTDPFYNQHYFEPSMFEASHEAVSIASADSIHSPPSIDSNTANTTNVTNITNGNEMSTNQDTISASAAPSATIQGVILVPIHPSRIPVPPRDKTHTCVRCGLVLTRKDGLAKHLLKCDGTAPKSIERTIIVGRLHTEDVLDLLDPRRYWSVSDFQTADESGSLLKCRACAQKFSAEYRLIAHIRKDCLKLRTAGLYATHHKQLQLSFAQEQLKKLNLSPTNGEEDFGKAVDAAQTLEETPNPHNPKTPSPFNNINLDTIHSIHSINQVSTGQVSAGQMVHLGRFDPSQSPTPPAGHHSNFPEATVGPEHAEHEEPKLPQPKNPRLSGDMSLAQTYPARTRLFSSELASSSPHNTSNPLDPFEDIPSRQDQGLVQESMASSHDVVASTSTAAIAQQSSANTFARLIVSFGNQRESRSKCIGAIRKIEFTASLGFDPRLRDLTVDLPYQSVLDCRAWEFKVTGPIGTRFAKAIAELFPLLDLHERRARESTLVPKVIYPGGGQSSTTKNVATQTTLTYDAENANFKELPEKGKALLGYTSRANKRSRYGDGSFASQFSESESDGEVTKAQEVKRRRVSARVRDMTKDKTGDDDDDDEAGTDKNHKSTN